MIKEYNIWAPIVASNVHHGSYMVKGPNGMLRRTSKHFRLLSGGLMK